VPPVAIDKLYFSCAFAAAENASADPRRTDAKALIAFLPVKSVPEKIPVAIAVCPVFSNIRGRPFRAKWKIQRVSVHTGPTFPRSAKASLCLLINPGAG
jgi:hypothetical protein